MGTGGPVALKLQEFGLEQYASAIVDDQGYDSIETLQGLSAEELAKLADEIKMKPGHKKSSSAALGRPQSQWCSRQLSQPRSQPRSPSSPSQPRRSRSRQCKQRSTRRW